MAPKTFSPTIFTLHGEPCRVEVCSSEEIADWIIQGRSDYRLIDLRSEAEYDQYHIPGASDHCCKESYKNLHLKAPMV